MNITRAASKIAAPPCHRLKLSSASSPASSRSFRYNAVLLFVLFVTFPKIVVGVCTPHNGPDGFPFPVPWRPEDDLTLAVGACLRETPDGSCPSFAADSNGTGCNDGGVNGKIGDWDVSVVSFMVRLFINQPLFNADITNWNTETVTSMHEMFRDASNFTINLSRWNVAKVANMNSMFRKATQYNVALCGTTWVSSTAIRENMFTGAGANAKIAKSPCSCLPGSFLAISSLTECEKCPSGKYQNENVFTKNSCSKLCSPGKYSNETGRTSDADCKLCSPGKYSNETGRTSDADCKLCSPGKYSNETGRTSNDQCTNCAPGLYSSEAGEAIYSCKNCLATKYSVVSASNSCKPCPTGWEPTKPHSSCTISSNPLNIRLIVGVTVAAFAASIFAFFLCRIFRQQKESHQVELEDHREETRRLLSLLQTEIEQISEGRQIEFNDLTWEKRLAAGAGGEVWKGKWRMMSEQHVAIKRIFLTDQAEQFRAEDFWNNLNLNGLTGSNRIGESKSDWSKISFPEVESVPAVTADISWTLEKEISLLMRIKPHPR